MYRILLKQNLKSGVYFNFYEVDDLNEEGELVGKKIFETDNSEELSDTMKALYEDNSMSSVMPVEMVEVNVDIELSDGTL